MNPVMLTYCNLVRPYILCTAFADILTSYFITHGSMLLTQELAVLLLVSGCTYAGGIIFQTLYGLERAAGSSVTHLYRRYITALEALQLGSAIWLGALTLAVTLKDDRSMGIVAFLVFTAWMYNARIRNWLFIGPLSMGVCRFFNILLGTGAYRDYDGILGFAVSGLLLTVLIVLLTYRDMIAAFPKFRRLLACGLLLAGIFPLLFMSVQYLFSYAVCILFFYGQVVLHILPVLRQGKCQVTVGLARWSVLLIISFDAAVTAGHIGLPAGCIVLSLLIPAGMVLHVSRLPMKDIDSSSSCVKP